jgi:asparagine synthase (glutamine-hydrolysing)
LLGVGARVVRAAERRGCQPLRDDRRGLCAIGDLRLDNRDELEASLSNSQLTLDSDLAIAVAAYERWGHQCARRLIGDFAFVIWNGRSREVYGARDHFGVRALVYHHRPERLIVATEPAQLLALPEIDRAPDPRTVVDLLSWSYAHYGRTFFRAVHALRPGHYFCATREAFRETEYVSPPASLSIRLRAEDYCDEFRALFRRAVRDRLDSQFPIVAHLSGGLDSSSIVFTADAIHRDEAGLAPVEIVSAIYAGQPHDESGFIDQVTRAVRLRAHRWDGNQPSGREFSDPPLSIPGSSAVFNGGSTGDIEIARQIGARAIFSGDPGDAATGEHGLFNELLRRGRWLTLARQIMSAATEKERRVRLRALRYAVREEAPQSLLRVWRTLNWRRRPIEAPRWLRREWINDWIGPEFRSPPRRGLGLNRLQQGIWDYLRWDRAAWSTDLFGTYAANAGLEARYPFLDVRLVDFILSVPVDHRLLGRLRRTLHRRAMAGIVPDAIAWRVSKPGFGAAVVEWGHRSAPAIRGILEEGQWRSEEFVDRDRARDAFQKLIARPPDSPDWEGWLGIRSIVNLETWLRAVFRYPRTQEILSMSETKPPREGEGDVGEGSQESYVPPALTHVGNVRDLLAGAPGSQVDSVDSSIGLG